MAQNAEEEKTRGGREESRVFKAESKKKEMKTEPGMQAEEGGWKAHFWPHAGELMQLSYLVSQLRTSGFTMRHIG